jgi:hypothetical protein
LLYYEHSHNLTRKKKLKMSETTSQSSANEADGAYGETSGGMSAHEAVLARMAEIDDIQTAFLVEQLEGATSENLREADIGSPKDLESAIAVTAASEMSEGRLPRVLSDENSGMLKGWRGIVVPRDGKQLPARAIAVSIFGSATPTPTITMRYAVTRPTSAGEEPAANWADMYSFPVGSEDRSPTHYNWQTRQHEPVDWPEVLVALDR